MSVQKFLGTIETDGIKDERGIETPSLSATGEVEGKAGAFTESVTAPVFNGKATSAGTADSATNATNDGEGNNIADTYATKEALAEETSAREAADETLSKGITAEATARSAAIEDIVDGTTIVAKATNATNATNATHAASADNATNATNDGEGNNIANTYATKTELAEISVRESVLPVRIEMRDTSGNNTVFQFKGVGFVPASVKDSLKINTPAEAEDVAAAMFSALGSMGVITAYGGGLKAGAADSVFPSLQLVALSATNLYIIASGFKPANDTNLTIDTYSPEKATFTTFSVD